MGPDKQTDGAAFEKEIADLFATDEPDETPDEEPDAALEEEKEAEAE